MLSRYPYASNDSTTFNIYLKVLLRIFKSKSSLIIFDKHANLKYKYGNRHWCREYMWIRWDDMKSDKKVYSHQSVQERYSTRYIEL